MSQISHGVYTSKGGGYVIAQVVIRHAGLIFLDWLSK